MPPDLAIRPAATFRGLRHVPLLAVSYNSLYPSLEIGADGVRVRIIRRHRLPFEEVEAVDLRWRLAHQIILIPRKGPWTFSANLMGRTTALHVLAALDARSLPLTDKARTFLTEADG